MVAGIGKANGATQVTPLRNLEQDVTRLLAVIGAQAAVERATSSTVVKGWSG